MKPYVSAMILATLLAQGCDRYAPGNTLEPEEGYAPVYVDDRSMVAQVASLEVEPTLGGMILLARGVPPTQGYWDADLIPVDRTGDGSARRFEFRIRPPNSPEPVGTVASRTIETGFFLSNAELRGVRQLVVIGADGARSIRR